jgi:hypothetical protein
MSDLETRFHETWLGMARRWWPAGKKVPVVVDPARAFGSPVVQTHGVPTRVLYAAHRRSSP